MSRSVILNEQSSNLALRGAYWLDNDPTPSLVFYTCPFVPVEWISAHGLSPRRVLPQATPLTIAAGVCPYLAAFLECIEQKPDEDAVVLTTACDQMRHAADLLERRGNRPVFLMNVPSTWQGQAAQDLYRDELLRLGSFLVDLGGREPSRKELKAKMLGYQTARGKLQPLAHSRAKDYAFMLGEFAGNPPAFAATAVRPETPGIPLALVGGPLMRDAFVLFDLIEASGGRVALNATENGELTLPAPFDPVQLDADPLTALADAYFGSIPHAFQRPNDRLYTWLAHELPARGIAGIIFLHYLWCDLWQGEMQRLKEWAPIPVIDLDLAMDPGATARAETRIQSLLEMLIHV